MTITLSRRKFLGAALAAPMAAGLTGVSTSAALAALAPLNSYSGPVRLNSNENALGISPMARRAILEGLDEANRYPDAISGQLEADTAQTLGVTRDHLLFANGSTEILAAFTAMAQREDATILAPALTFEAVEGMAKTLKARFETVPMLAGHRIDLDGLERRAAKTKGPVLVYLVTPNNPTGELVSSQQLHDWIKRAPAHVSFLVDEAYHDFVEHPDYVSSVRLIKEGAENLIVARTFSKLHALAGLRIGFAVMPGVMRARVQPLMPWGNMNMAGIVAALASLRDGDFQARSLASNREARTILTEKLDALGLDYVPSHGNFVFHQIGTSLAPYAARMKQAGWHVGRPFGGLETWNRLSLATPDIMQRFVATLDDFRSRGWV